MPSILGIPSSLQPLFNAGISLLEADAFGLIANVFGVPTWGIFLFGVPVVLADNVVSFEMNKDWMVSDYPIEGGLFESYNKVYRPFVGTFRFSAGGSLSNRQLFLASVEAISGDMNIYDLVTPEAVYSGVNVIAENFVRNGQSGAGLVSVDIKVSQVRSAVSASYTSTATPESSAQVNDGPVQPKTPPADIPPVAAIAPLDPIEVTPLPPLGS